MLVPGAERQPKETARDYALRFLLHHIVNLKLLPGAMVSANELSELMGISRTPIREAMQELDKVGLISIYPQAGSQISHIDYSKIHESRAIRLALETEVVEAACAVSLSVRDIDFFESNMKAQENSLERGDMTALMDLDNLFHRQFYVIAEKMMTYQVMSDVRCHFDRVRRLSLDALDRIEIVKDHHELLKAVVEGDRQAARTLVTSHLSRYLVDEERIRAKYPSYFANWSPKKE